MVYQVRLIICGNKTHNFYDDSYCTKYFFFIEACAKIQIIFNASMRNNLIAYLNTKIAEILLTCSTIVIYEQFNL
jgi:hypothetical protein